MQVDRFVRAMVGRAVNAPAAVQQPRQRLGQIAPRRVVDGKVVQPGRVRRRRMTARAVPGVEPDVVVVAAGRQECGRAHVDEQVEAHQVAVKVDSLLQVGNLEMHVSNARLCGQGIIAHGQTSGFLRREYLIKEIINFKDLPINSRPGTPPVPTARR